MSTFAEALAARQARREASPVHQERQRRRDEYRAAVGKTLASRQPTTPLDKAAGRLVEAIASRLAQITRKEN